MRDINLLPPKQKQKQLALSIITYITFGFLLLLVTVIGFAVTLTTIQVTITDNINTYGAKREAIDKRVMSFKSLETDVTSTNNALKLAASALDLQLHPTSIMRMISDHIGDSVTLSSLVLARGQSAAAKSTASDAIQVTIAGTATERAGVIDFKRALEETKSFNDVTYTIGSSASTNTSSSSAAASTTTPSGTNTLSFTITTSIASPNKSATK